VTPAAVGNDVVDLVHPPIDGDPRDGGFGARICAPGERERVRTARDLWDLFAAKEAAYKVLVKLGGTPGFRSMYVAADGSCVTWRGQPIALSLHRDDDHVHAVAWTGARRPFTRVARAEPGGPPEGEQARAVLCDLVAASLGLQAAELRVVRELVPGAWDGRGPPRIERSGAPVDADVSLSHDGRFVAAAALVTGSLRP
jgi:phosphopantetheinyl transferase (holo-ACP synthase)